MDVFSLQEKITNNYGNKVNGEGALLEAVGNRAAIALRLAASGANVTLMASDLTFK